MKKAPMQVSKPVLTPESTVAAGLFKATCLELMDRVHERGEVFVITKHGKPVAKLVPVKPPQPRSGFGCMEGTVTIHGDIISPIDDEW